MTQTLRLSPAEVQTSHNSICYDSAFDASEEQKKACWSAAVSDFSTGVSRSRRPLALLLTSNIVVRTRCRSKNKVRRCIKYVFEIISIDSWKMSFACQQLCRQSSRPWLAYWISANAQATTLFFMHAGSWYTAVVGYCFVLHIQYSPWGDAL